MSRTLGDSKGGEVVSAVPEVRQVTIPATGARLVIASDGLWDAVEPRAMVGQTRKLTAAQAAFVAQNMSLKKFGLRDDITILVIDFCTTENDLKPVALGAGKQMHVEPVHVCKPLETPSNEWVEELISCNAKFCSQQA
jgi:serine/threonine protein phosphatase PrpC